MLGSPRERIMKAVNIIIHIMKWADSGSYVVFKVVVRPDFYNQHHSQDYGEITKIHNGISHFHHWLIR